MVRLRSVRIALAVVAAHIALAICVVVAFNAYYRHISSDEFFIAKFADEPTR